MSLYGPYNKWDRHGLDYRIKIENMIYNRHIVSTTESNSRRI
uniref:Uncharacterized protein n=1 Tax=Arundo donax TaxID=35708 RepID=A0A0A9UAG4_ARUDO